jgi:hypothetical protein
MEEVIKMNWKHVDYRIQSLNHIINGLWTAIQALEKRMEVGGWYDAIWFREDSEPIFGLAFIAFQNYINASIIDRYESIAKKEDIYRLGKYVGKSDRTEIELIIALANYTKHKDWGELHTGTKNILSDIGLKTDLDTDITELPIFEGIEILSSLWDLNEVLKIVTNWRESLWESI